MRRVRPRRIAIAYDCLFPYTTGGGERQYRGFAERIAARGHRVDYLTTRQWDGPDPSEDAFAVVPITGRLDLYDDDGVRSTSAALRYAWGLFRTLRRRRRSYDAVIVSALPALNVPAARLALLGSGTILVADYLEVWGRRQWLEYAGAVTGLLGWAAQRVAIALTPIATCHSALSERRLRAEGMRRPVLVSPGLIDARAEHGMRAEADSPPYVLYAGRHIPDKRVPVLPAAVAAARVHLPELELTILGDGPDGDAVDAAVDAAGAQDWTHRPGFVDEQRLDALMAGAACVVNPSRREGYGLVVVEAASHGTPTVLVRDEGNAATELIEDDVNGFVADSADAGTLGEALRRAVAAGPQLRARTYDWYTAAARTRTLTETVESILATIDSAATARGGARTPQKEQP